MKRYFIAVFLFCWGFHCLADEPLKPLILDVQMMPTVMQAHLIQNYYLEEIDDTQKKIIGYQKIIDEKLGKIDTLEMKTQNYRSNLQDIMLNANQKKYLNGILNDIAKKQQEINKLASENPEFQSVANATNMELNERAQKVMDYMDKCGQYAGLKGQLDNKERTDITLFVAKEFTKMRGVAVDALRTIETAKYSKYLNQDLSTLLKKVYNNQ